MSTSENFVTGLTCEFCRADVASGDDYRNHLKLVHNLMKNIPAILDRAVQKITKPEAKVVIEEIVLDDDEDIEEEAGGNETFSDLTVDMKIENQISDFVQDLFKDLNIMIDGILPEDVDLGDIKEEIKETEVSNEISSCFDDLKSFVENLEIPADFEFEKELGHNSEIAQSQKEPSNFLNSTEIKSSKIEKKSAFPKPEPGQTLFCCQVANCSFYTTKAEFRSGTAARHLKEDHNVKPAHMAGGKYKFHKIKGERLSKK